MTLTPRPGRSLAGFVARLPAILAVISRGIARAIWQLLERVSTAIWNGLKAIGRFIAEIAKWLWTAYCKIEHSLLQVFVSLILSIWSLRLLVGLVAIGVALGYFKLWIPLVAYVIVLTVAVLLYFRMNAEDEVRATEAQRPLKDWLMTALRWVLRAGIAMTSGLLLFASGSINVSAIWKGIATIHRAEQPTVSNEIATIGAARPVPENPAPRPTQNIVRIATPTDTSAAQQINMNAPRAIVVSDVAKTVEDSILQVLNAAQVEPRSSVEDLAKQAGRSFDFSTYHVERNRKEARRLNEAAMHAFQVEENPALAYKLQKQAMAADPLDVEVAGNMAIYALRVGYFEEARLDSLYALALPKAPERTGRTADWSTLAASYAGAGNALQARNALFVTLAIAPEIAKRCRSAVHAVKYTYGDVMKDPTLAMFARIKEQGLSDSPECALPIEW